VYCDVFMHTQLLNELSEKVLVTGTFLLNSSCLCMQGRNCREGPDVWRNMVSDRKTDDDRGKIEEEKEGKSEKCEKKNKRKRKKNGQK